MPTLALMEQGTTLGVEGEVFSVEKEGAVVNRVRMAEVDELLVFGSITLTPAAIAALLRRGIDTVFLTARGQYRGRLIGKPGKNVPLRLAQFDRLRDPAVAVPLARALVGAKVANQRYVLLRSQREQASTGSAQGRREDLAEATAGLRRVTEALEVAGDVDTVRGLEGQAAAIYFGNLGRCIRNQQFTFKTRTRRPPRDPVNAMLSFGYTLLGAVMESAVLRVGLDPMLGVFHSPDYGRPSLVLDLIEEFRPVLVDALVLRVLNRREVAPEDFEEFQDEADAMAVGEEGGEARQPVEGPVPSRTEEPVPESRQGGIEGPVPSSIEGAVWLGPTGRRIFFRAWGRRLRETHFYEVRRQTLTLEEIMQQQVYQLARFLSGETDRYRAFLVR
jgi:CRISPR-associated protein Cas1